MRKTLLFVLLVIGGTPAAAHVTVQPDEAATGEFARFVVRVPNERDAAATVKVEVQLPEELVAVSFQPAPGWRRTVERKPRREPVDVFGEQVTDYVATVTWEGGRIEPGEFEEFGFSARTPAEPTTLAFPAVQTYDNGEAVRWTGPADAEEPAARVQTFRLEGGPVSVLSGLASDDGDDGVPAVVPWAALVVAVAALVGAAAAWRRS
ncbi:MAG TPA: YcnI family protein [Acidimicrobiales bacterium]|nr:YcnI family protein [Acidimicrobiales bacterium]